MRRVPFALLLVLLLRSVASWAQGDPCNVPLAGPDNWPVAAPAEVGLDAATLCQATTRFQAWKEANVHAILVARGGKLVFESYFAGLDEHWGHGSGTIRFNAETLHDVRSITKSVTSLLLGIAIDRGWVAGIDQPVLSLLPEYADLRSPEKDRITLRHLLTMSAGLAWDENQPYGDLANSETQMDRAADPYRYALARPVALPPGKLYNYSGGGAAVIADLLHKATGKPFDVLARELLFQPLGITDIGWERYPVNDEPVTASGLRLRPRDLLKIGQLVLNHGVWDGTQVVPAAWIAQSIAPQIQGSQLYFYGFQWWLGRSLVDGKEADWAAGVGYGGQRLYIIPSLDMVVAVNAGLYASELQGWVPLQILNRHALAAIAAPNRP